MSLFGALNTAVSGLGAQASAFGNIGDNIANSQTTGFKGINTSFEDYLTVSNSQVNESGAVVARPSYANSLQGPVSQTANPLAMAITGQGFFTVSQQNGDIKGTPTFSKNVAYTRTGDFTVNKDGYLVNSAGNFLTGYVQNAATGAIDKTTLSQIHIGETGYAPVPTSDVTISANLPATPSSPAPILSQIPVTDALGQSQTVQLQWTQISGSPNTWQVAVSQPGIATPLGTAKVVFGTTGNPAAPDGTPGSITSTSGNTVGSSYAAGAAATLGFTADFGSGPQAISLNLGTFGQPGGLTQFAGTEYSPRSLTQNGVAPGSFSSVAAQSNGDIVVNFDNGQSRVVANVPVTTFANPDALQRLSGQAFSASIDSGSPQVLQAGANGAGGIVTNALEGSNVDIAAEFTKLIVAQRAYSANTKMVTTADELLQQTIDMKR